jgi:putative PIN family toxin of toxin-antitoxin system
VIRATADSNIYISALHFGGPPDDFLDLARSGAIHLSISDDIINEVTRVLREKFGWSKEALALFQERIQDFTERVVPTQRIDVVKEDPADNRIVECAVAGKSEYLVTRDNHLLKLNAFGGTQIIKVADFLEMFRRRSQER